MKNNLLIIAGFLACTLQFVHAQNPLKLNVIPPSPEASALTKYGDIPISAYTGVPQINIPIYTVKSGNIQVPISLSYHASGIRVDEEATSVGLGWSLQAGGAITHTIRGKDDLVLNFYFDTSIPEFQSDYPIAAMTDNMFQNGCSFYFINSPHDLTPFVQHGAGTTMYYCDPDPAVDFEPDQYSFSFMGHSGKFTITRNKTIVIASQEKIDIQPTWNGNDITKWQIRVKDGTKYVFDKTEYYQDTDCPAVNSKTAWYLSQVISPTGITVTFTYSVSSATMTRPIGSVFERQAYSLDGNCPGGNSSTKQLNQSFKKYTTVTLQKILFDNGQVNFDVDSSRVDLQNSKRLNAISVFRKNASGTLESIPFKKFNLSYDYFLGTPYTTDAIYGSENDYHLKRLKLISVQETHDTQVIPPYVFHYYEGAENNLPSKGSFARDHWGYYNGAINNTTMIPSFTGLIYTRNIGTLTYNNNNLAHTDGTPLSAQELADAFAEKTYFKSLPGGNREPSALNISAFTLKDIIYPTGGKTEFKFEPHDYDEDDSNVNTHTPKIQVPDLKDASITCTQNSWGELNQIKNNTIDLRNIYVPKGQTAGEITFKFNFISINGMNALQTQNAGLAYVEFASTHIDVHDANNAKCPTTGYYSCNCFVDDPNIPGTEPKTNCEFYQTFLITPGIYTFKSFIATQAKDYITYISASFNWKEPVNSSASPISLAGGLRISEMIDYDIDGSVTGNRKFNYHYQIDRNGDGILETRSFGRRMSKPIYISYEQDQYLLWLDGCSTCTKFYEPCYRFVRTSDSVVPNNGSANGSVVGYDQVEVLYGKDANGNYGIGGKTVYEFENNPDEVFDYGLWRKPGILNFSSNRNGLQKRVTEYKYKYGTYQKIKETINDYGTSANQNILYGLRRDAYNFSVNPTPSNCDVNLFCFPALKSEWIQLGSSTEIDYDEIDPLKMFTKVTNFYYDNPNHFQLTRQSTTDSKGSVHLTKMKYPLDYPSPAGSLMDSLNSRFIVDPVIEQIQSIDGKVTAATGQKYFVNAANTNQLLLKDVTLLETSVPLTSFSESTDGKTFSSYMKRATYNKYDSRGNVLQFTKEKDTPIAIVWGYNNTLPVAQIENATYAQVSSVLGSSLTTLQTLDGDPLRTALAPLRTNLPNAQVSIYTYDPLVGMTSKVDQNGTITYFEYDNLGRLVRIKDNQNKLVKSFDYKYYNEQQ